MPRFAEGMGESNEEPRRRRINLTTEPITLSFQAAFAVAITPKASRAEQMALRIPSFKSRLLPGSSRILPL
jgi:hypothetical protein